MSIENYWSFRASPLNRAWTSWNSLKIIKAFRSMLRSRVQEHFPLYQQFNLQWLQLYNVQSFYFKPDDLLIPSSSPAVFSVINLLTWKRCGLRLIEIDKCNRRTLPVARCMFRISSTLISLRKNVYIIGFRTFIELREDFF